MKTRFLLVPRRMGPDVFSDGALEGIAADIRARIPMPVRDLRGRNPMLPVHLVAGRVTDVRVVSLGVEVDVEVTDDGVAAELTKSHGPCDRFV